LFGSLAIAGGDAGPDKMFKPKGVVKAGGTGLLPNAPAAAVAVAAAADGSKFAAADAGNYTYTVHAVNECGISEGKNPAARSLSGGRRQ
jgi:hypothetical protein